MRYLIAALLLTTACGQLIKVNSTQSPVTDKVAKPVVYGDTYIVGVPKCIRPGLPADVYVDIVKRVSSVEVTVELLNKTTGEVFDSNKKTVSPGYPQIITLQVPRELTFNWRQYTNLYYIKVTGRGPGISFVNMTSVQFDQKNVTGFLQTDKAIYKPSQRVQYRLFTLDPALKINRGVYNIEIRDPKGNKIRSEEGVYDPTGLIKGFLDLSDEPVYGYWQISAVTAGSTLNKRFEVKEYVLPRIEVTVTPPSFITVTQPTVDVTVTAKYTFGEDARGSLLLTGKFSYWYSRFRNESQPIIQQRIDNFQGTATVSFPTAAILDLQDNWSWNPIVFEANLTESLTGTVSTAKENARIYKVAEKVQYVSSPRVFKPSLTYTAHTSHRVAQGLSDNLVCRIGYMANGNPNICEEAFWWNCPLKEASPIDSTTISVITLKAKVTKQDGSPIDLNSEKLKVIVQQSYYENVSQPIVKNTDKEGSLSKRIVDVWYPEYKTVNVTYMELDVPADGIVEINVKFVPRGAENINIISSYNGQRAWLSARKAYSPSNSFIQLIILKELLAPGERQKIELRSNVPIGSFGMLVTSRGRIVLAKENLKKPAIRHAIKFPITRDMAPRARVVVYYRTPTGEIVPDVVSFNVLDAFKNKVSVSFDAEEVRPGEDVNMTVRADPGSMVATLVLDKKVLLLKSGNDITEEEVTNSLWSFESCGYFGWWRRGPVDFRRRRKRSFIPWRYPYYSGGRDANSVFSEAGLTVLTDSLLYTHTYRNLFRDNVKLAESEADGGDGNRVADGQLKEVTKLRTKFPETWLFLVEFTDDNGQVTIPTTAPDSITSWQATAFAFNDESGFGITSAPAMLTVVKPFFANLYLPYSVIRGEEIFVQVNVFNYLPEEQNVEVELKGSESFLSLDIDNAGNEVLVSGARKQTIKVPSGIPRSVVFPIRATELGEISLTATARSTVAADGLTKTILVKPEGVPDEYNFVELVDLSSASQYSATRQIKYPPGLVQGSQKLGVKIVGDVLGRTFDNLENLVRMSYGCGEQNMVRFAPTVVVSNYLKKVNQFTPERLAQAKNFINLGYQRQLNYKRQDGSYSAFGDRDKEGSLWLTAFVVKSFNTAVEGGFIAIDQEALNSAYEFIVRRQLKDGSLNSSGVVHHKRMQGQSGNGFALTAYGLIALLENDNLDAKFTGPRDRALAYVESYLPKTKDLYELAIGVYALALAKSPLTNTILATLESRATNQDGYTFWEVEGVQVYTWERPVTRSKAASIEATSYVCLVYGLRADKPKSSQCLSYLASQQNDYGGYVSTQDTVLAVQALSGIAPFFYSEKPQGTIKVTAAGEFVTFNIQDSNRLDIQSATLPVSADSVTVSGSGTGIFLVSVSAKYNVDDGTNRPAFTVTAELTKDTPTLIELTVCAKYDIGEASNMANIEIRLPTDFTLDGASRDELLESAKRVETFDGKVLLYFDSITSKQTCVYLRALGSGLINKPKPCPVRVFDYYSTDENALTFYQVTSLNGNWCDASACNNTGGCANCTKRKRK